MVALEEKDQVYRVNLKMFHLLMYLKLGLFCAMMDRLHSQQQRPTWLLLPKPDTVSLFKSVTITVFNHTI